MLGHGGPDDENARIKSEWNFNFFEQSLKKATAIHSISIGLSHILRPRRHGLMEILPEPSADRMAAVS